MLRAFGRNFKSYLSELTHLYEIQSRFCRITKKIKFKDYIRDYNNEYKIKTEMSITSNENNEWKSRTARHENSKYLDVLLRQSKMQLHDNLFTCLRIHK